MKFKFLFFIFVFLFITIAGTMMVSATSDSYTINFIVPSDESTTGNIIHITPSTSGEVPHMILGKNLKFSIILSPLKKIKWNTNFLQLVLLH